MAMSAQKPFGQVIAALMVGKPYEFVLYPLPRAGRPGIGDGTARLREPAAVGRAPVLRSAAARPPDVLPHARAAAHDRGAPDPPGELEQALHELATLEAERRRLLERTVEATEEERRRIAAELHDGPIQHLAAIVFRLESVRGGLERGNIPGTRCRPSRRPRKSSGGRWSTFGG